MNTHDDARGPQPPDLQATDDDDLDVMVPMQAAPGFAREHHPSPVQPDLAEMQFNAKIDFITFGCSRKLTLPTLDGRVCWPSKYHYTRFSVHDPSAADIRTLAASTLDLTVLELEVAVDLRPATVPLNQDEHAELLRSWHQFVARHLEPSGAPYMNTSFRACHDGRPRPFNRCLPPAHSTLYYGHGSQPVSVKAYIKVGDQRQPLPSAVHAVRVEVSLRQAALKRLGVHIAADVPSFAFRRALTPYFTMVRAIRRRPAGPRDLAQVVPMSELVAGDEALWRKVGVGAFVNGGQGAVANVRFIRHTAFNNRIGQALGRLEARIQREFRARGTASG